MCNLTTFINNTLLTKSGTLNPKRTHLDWFTNHGLIEYYDVIVNSTSFLGDVKFYMRVHMILKNIDRFPKCKCGNDITNWNDHTKNFYEFCSLSCGTYYTKDKQRETKELLYGDIHYNNRKQAKETCLDRYGNESYTQTEEFKTRVKNTNITKYGYGATSQSPIVKQKAKETCLDRYGSESYTQTEEFKQKAKETCLDRYGSEFFTKSKKYRDSFDHLPTLFDIDEAIELYNKHTNCAMVSQILGVSQSNVIVHLTRAGVDLRYMNSIAEIEIIEFLKEHIFHPVLHNDRTCLGGKELDIFLPEYKLAIEYNGIYWHTEGKGKDRTYHLAKTRGCEERGIQLLHIYENEWNDPIKQNIWKSMILSKLGLTHRVFARKCVVREVSMDESRDFMVQNHLSGFRGGGIKLGLYYNDELMQMVIVGKSRYDKAIEYELIRSATKTGITVVGGLSKLLARCPDNMVSYADRRYSDGKGYDAVGMKKSHESPPNYRYLVDSKLESRNKYQKHKLNKLVRVFDSTMSEYDNMLVNGYDRVWDCGSLVYIK